ncbi:hypothetical protein BU15DRAFT_56167 [Melanogaster broomeanus]|nr:hypothetical protein BU15DRAFT_56167 [Melanogaster broomeanus]
MSVDMLSHFGGLDELIQVIYQGFDRFVVLSQVNDSAWTVYLGLKGPEGRWWRGSWSEKEITQLIGSKASSRVVENFADKLSETFVNGELSVGDWIPDHGARINLTVGPTSKKPLHVPLVELSPTEAASNATALLSEIALQAQSRKCRLNPATFSAPTATTAGPSRAAPARGAEPAPAAPPADQEAQRKIMALEAELAEVKATTVGEPDQKVATSARPPKGASLANPHKKARKYQPVEFED